jgi:3-hydroxyisobutyrate dehydrogenase-like beta-hydroxyacid dehydrogenase
VWKKDLGIVSALAAKHGLRGRMSEAALQGYKDCGDRFGGDKDDSFFSKMLEGSVLHVPLFCLLHLL